MSALIGNTPLIELKRINPNPSQVRLLAKCEFYNPTGSIKDRMVRYLFEESEKQGELSPGQTVLCSSSGNTGASVAFFCSQKGYPCIVFVPPKCSQEKIAVMEAYGAKVMVIASGYEGLDSEIAQEDKNFFAINQYANALNPQAYYFDLGPELWKQANGEIDYFIAGASSGGTLSGTSKFLKEKDPSIKTLLPDPEGSALATLWKGQKADYQPYKVEGVGKNEVVEAFDFEQVDEVASFDDEACFNMCQRVAREEGLLIGGSSGLNLCGAVYLANKATSSLNIVVVLPDTGLKYLSKIFSFSKNAHLKPIVKSEVYESLFASR